MGVDRTVVRTVLFGISAAIAGLAGGIFAVDTGILTPDSFSLLFTIYLLVAMVLGGRASYWGPIIGGFAIYFLPLWTGEITEGPAAGVVFGVLIIVMVFTLRDGVIGGLKRLGARFLVVEPHSPRPAWTSARTVEWGTLGSSIPRSCWLLRKRCRAVHRP